MNKVIRIVIGVVAVGCLCVLGSRLWDNRLSAQENQPPVDWDRAQALMQKQRAGQLLTPEERAYLERARQMRRQGVPQNGQNEAANRPRNDDLSTLENLLIKQQLGGTLTAAEEAQVEEARRRFGSGRAGAERTLVSFKPLTEMSATDDYKGEKGGLYGAGRNTPPEEHEAAAERALAQIKPLDDRGNANANGKIVLLSIGMSNTTQEFSFFKRLADQSPLKNRQVVIVDAAQGGRAADDWARGDAADPRGRDSVWNVAAQRLQAESVTSQQVQAIWIKQALRSPSGLGEHPEHTRQLQADLQRIVQIAKEQFPKLRIIYLSSRIYAGYATSQLNPEPYAYESAFAVRGLIQDQIAGKPELNHDPAKGEVKAPVLLWGPYLWGSGMTVRADNKIVWAPDDFMQDGTHPSPFGRAKVAAMLYDFFTTSPYARSWFVPTDAVALDACFLRTRIIGYSQVGQRNGGWFVAGGAFERAVEGNRWELLWNGGAGVDQWREPDYTGWNRPLVSPVPGEAPPDRVLLSISGPYSDDEKSWAEAIAATVENIRAKIPSARQIVLQPVVGGVEGNPCPAPNGGMVRASWQHKHIINAIQEVVKEYSTANIQILAGYAPRVRTCEDYSDALGHLKPEAAAAIGREIGEYYACWDAECAQSGHIRCGKKKNIA